MKKEAIATSKWYEGVEHTVHTMMDDQQVHVFYFPHMKPGLPKVIQFQSYSRHDAVRQIASLLESAIYQLQEK